MLMLTAGEYQYGTADECPKPGVAGMALNAAPRFLDSWQGEEEEWDETLWRLPRNKAPVDVAGALTLLAALLRC